MDSTTDGHATQAGMDLPAEPVVFRKAPDTVLGPDDDVLIPPGSARTDVEVEFVVVIGRTARYLPDVAVAPGALRLLIQPGLAQLGGEQVQDRRQGQLPLISLAVSAGDLLFVSGQASVDPDGMIVPGRFADLPAPRPARTTITGCLTDAIKFETDVVAYAPPEPGSG